MENAWREASEWDKNHLSVVKCVLLDRLGALSRA